MKKLLLCSAVIAATMYGCALATQKPTNTSFNQRYVVIIASNCIATDGTIHLIDYCKEQNKKNRTKTEIIKNILKHKKMDTLKAVVGTSIFLYYIFA